MIIIIIIIIIIVIIIIIIVIMIMYRSTAEVAVLQAHIIELYEYTHSGRMGTANIII